MTHGYANAREVLPVELLSLVQQYHTGMLWVPERRDFYRARNAMIRELRAEGRTVKSIAARVSLSERRVWQILRGEMDEGIFE